MKQILSLLVTCFLFASSSWADVLPYSIDFSSSQEGWTTIDNSEVPGKTWVFQKKAAYIRGTYFPAITTESDYSSTADDYYVSPAFTLKANTSYTLKSTALRCQGLEVVLGTSNTDAGSFKLLGDIVCDDDYNYNFEPEEITFTVQEDGTYYIAYHGTTEMYQPYPAGYLFGMELTTEDESGTVDPDPIATIPYNIDFTKDITDWKAVDNNNDGHTWVEPLKGYGITIDYNYSYNDDFVSPRFILEKDSTYRITCNVSIDYGTIDELSLVVKCDDGEFNEIKRFSLKEGVNNEEIIYTATGNDCQFAYRIVDTTGGYKSQVRLVGFGIEEYVTEDDNTPLLSTDFTEENPMLDWNVDDSNNDGTTWGLLEGLQGITYDGENAAGAANDWLFTPGLNMKDGQDYLIEFIFLQTGAFGADNIEIKYGNAAVVEKMNNMIADPTIEFENGFGEKSFSYRITGNGNKTFIGFHIMTPDVNGKLTLASIKVSPVAKSTPAKAENFDAISDYAQKSVKLTWKNPSLDINGVEITSPMTAKIYENEVLVVVKSGIKAGEEEECILYPSVFEGMVTYKLVISIGEQNSEAVSKTINLDDQQGEQILVKSFRNVNKQNSKDWFIEDNSGKFKWEYDYSNVFRFNYGGMKDTGEDDWLISPSFTLESGNRYIVKYELKTSRDYSTSVDVCLGMGNTSKDLGRVLNSHKDLKQNGFGEFETAQFTVDETGEYNIGFHVYDANIAASMRCLEIFTIGEPTAINNVSEKVSGISYDSSSCTLYLNGKKYMVEIYDMQGALVEKKVVDNGIINVSELNNGVYCVRVNSYEGGTNVFKFIK